MKIIGSIGLILAFAALALTTACDTAGSGIRVTAAWIRASPMMARALAAYMVIDNGSSADDRLVSVQCNFARSAELHKSEDVNGMMDMTSLPAIVIPAHGQAVLQPGGMHIMLMALQRQLQVGEHVTLNLTFEKAGVIAVQAAVRDQ